MKRKLFALLMLVGIAAGSSSARADVSVDFFYNNLSGGSWIEVGDYGYCWQPDVAVEHNDWRPYADGYWAYTDDGWTWVSYEDFGWATYHYGRWAHLTDVGWVWVPGRDEDMEWGPAWVSWRTGGEYVGWAPLPPAGEPIYEGRVITGNVDVEFDIGPAYYNFVDVRYIGEPVLRDRIVPVTQNITYVNQTVNVTNITYKNKIVYNYGPDITVINQHSARPIQRLKIERQDNVDFAAVAKSGGLKTRVQGQSLIVAAPAHIAKPPQRIAPPNVKTKVAKANLDTGWAVVGDAQAKEQFKQQLKAQKTGVAAAASFNTQGGAGAGASTGGANANVNTNVNAGAGSNAETGHGGKHAAGNSSAETGGATAPNAATEADTGRGQGDGKHHNRANERGAAAAMNSPAGSENASGNVNAHGNEDAHTGGDGGGKHNRRNEQMPPAAESHVQTHAGAAATNEVSQGQNQGQDQEDGGGRARRLERQQQRQLQQPPSQQAGAITPNNNVPPQNVQGQEGGGGRQHDMNGGSASNQSQDEGKGQGQGQRQGHKNKNEASPAPTP